MKLIITPVLALACASSCLAGEALTAKQLQSFPKNLARQHLQANLLIFDAAAKNYIATEAAAAWLDDDVATGWPAMAGRQNYLLQFANSQVVSNFSVLSAPFEGSITIYSSDEVKPPGDPSWRVIAKDIPAASINQKKLAKSFNRQAKFILVETNIANPAPIFSFYAYGTRAAANDAIQPRATALDVQAVFGDFVNHQTSFNVASIYGGAKATYGNGSASQLDWQKALDENPESAAVLKSGTDSSLVVNLGEGRTVSRMSLLSDKEAKGKVDVYLLAEAPAAGHPVALDGVKPSVTLTFDGSNSHVSADFEDTTAVAMALRWTPETADNSLALREINAFANLSLSDYEVAPLPAAVGEAPIAATDAVEEEAGKGVDGKTILPIGDGKETADFKGGGKSIKEAMPPAVGAGPESGYFPGGLGFPPNFVFPRESPRERRSSP